MADIAVIVVNWNAREDLRACLRSLEAEPPSSVSHSVWVVDNASTDGSADMVQAEFPDVHLFANSENVGFSRANNQAIAQSDSRYVFLLNSDATIHPGALETLVRWADENPQTGIIGPKVLNPDGTLQFSCRRFPSLEAGFFRNTYLGRLFPNNKPSQDYLMSEFDHATTRTVDWVSGCAMLIRQETIAQIGSLDERFYMYCEDVDLCERAGRFGWNVAYLPDALVTHAIGRSSDKDAEKMIWEFHRSWYEFDKKRHPDAGPVRRLAVWAGLWLRATIRIQKRRAAFRNRQQTEATPSVPASNIPVPPQERTP
jgi:GT2 family glycosyltransferase